MHDLTELERLKNTILVRQARLRRLRVEGRVDEQELQAVATLIKERVRLEKQAQEEHHRRAVTHTSHEEDV